MTISLKFILMKMNLLYYILLWLIQRITFYFSSGTGLTPEGAACYIFAMQRILQLSKREGNSSLIRHVVLSQLLIHHIEKPFTRDSLGPGYNIPKYELESANAARLLAMNSTNKNLPTFISATERVGLDEDLACADPIRANYPFSMIHRLRDLPNAYQTSLETKCHLPKNSTWPSRVRSQGGALSLKTLGEYAANLHAYFPPLQG